MIATRAGGTSQAYDAGWRLSVFVEVDFVRALAHLVCLGTLLLGLVGLSTAG